MTLAQLESKESGRPFCRRLQSRSRTWRRIVLLQRTTTKRTTKRTKTPKKTKEDDDEEDNEEDNEEEDNEEDV